MQEQDLILLPGMRSRSSTLRVLWRFEFDAKLMRSGVVVSEAGKPAVLLVRGAPNKVGALVGASALPSDFLQVLCDRCAHQPWTIEYTGTPATHLLNVASP